MDKRKQEKVRKLAKNPSKNEELRLRVYELCDELGYWNINNTVLAEKLGTAHQNIHRWKNEYLAEFGERDIKKLGHELSAMNLSVLKRLGRLSNSEDKKLSVSAANAFIAGSEKYTEILERFGYKDVVGPVVDNNITITWGERPQDKINDKNDEGEI